MMQNMGYHHLLGHSSHHTTSYVTKIEKNTRINVENSGSFFFLLIGFIHTLFYMKNFVYRPSGPGEYVSYSGPYTLPPADERSNKAIPQQPSMEYAAEYQYPADSISQVQPRVPVQRKNFYGDIIDK